MRSLTIYKDGTFSQGLGPEEARQALADPTCVTWLEIQDPTEADVELLRERIGFHPLAVEDATRSHERPKVDIYYEAPAAAAASPRITRVEETLASSHAGYYFVVFYAASWNSSTNHIDTQSINMFIGTNYFVTVHYGPMQYIEECLARWQAPASPLGHRIGALVHALLDAIVDDYFPLMDQITERMEELEDLIFVHHDESAVEMIFSLKRDLVTLRRVVGPERDVLNVLLRRDLPIFKSKDMAYLQDVYDHLVRMTDSIDTYRDLLSSALDGYLSLQSNYLNQIMKLLTMGSIVLMTASLIAGIYGMNFKFMPELNWRLGYAWALGLMATASIVLIIVFRRRRWW